MSEAGASAAQELAFTFSNAITYVQSAINSGMDVDDFAGRMEIVGEPDKLPPVQEEVQQLIIKNDDQNRPMISIERFAFYDFAKTSYAVIQTGERRFYGCFMLRKGVIPPEE